MYFRKPRGSLFGNAVMSQEEIDRFLGERHCATLGYQNVNGFPGVAPVNYAWDGKAFYLHCARKGERYESLLRNQRWRSTSTTTPMTRRMKTAWRST